MEWLLTLGLGALVVAVLELVLVSLFGLPFAAAATLLGAAALCAAAWFAGRQYEAEDWRRRRGQLRLVQQGQEQPVADAATPAPRLSVVVPCYNEEARVASMLRETTAYLASSPLAQQGWEIIVVDDGSRDRSVEVVEQTAKECGVADKVRVLCVHPNRGKGYAVKQGVFAASGELVLMADADGATRIADVETLAERLSSSVCIVIGSRAHLEQEATAARSGHRTLLMHLFHFCVAFTFAFCGVRSQLRDTQCGFKLFTRTAARQAFSNLHLERWAFDVELLIIAYQLGLGVAEQQVHWQEIDGSKMTMRGMVRMGVELLLTCLCKRLGVWRLDRRIPGA